MYISKIDIHDFRAFQKPFSMELGRYITVISGLNGIGKSTILAILTNSSELKISDGKLLNNEPFRGDFSDIIMYDSKNDTTGDKVDIYFEDLPTNNEQGDDRKNYSNIYVRKLTYRATIQHGTRKNTIYKKVSQDMYKKNISEIQTTRYRLIPKEIPNVRNSTSKINWPSYYLGLSRIYPIGEADTAKKIKLDKNISEEIVKVHESILSEYLTESNLNPKFENLNIENLKKAKAGIETNEYSATSNSSGQDNLGQIILTIISYEKLKDTLGEKYNGGILAIDELDATLHPSAQNKLFEWLFKKSKQLNIQIVFTTHSLSLLKYISNKETEKGVSPNDIKISYLTKEIDKPGLIKEKINLDPNAFKYYLTETYYTQSQFKQPVNIITEDEVARNFCRNIISFSNNPDNKFQNINFLDVNISWTHLLNLLSSLKTNFRDVLFILDPDLNNSKDLKDYIYKNQLSLIPNNSNGNLFILPGDNSIEKMMYEYLMSLPSDHEFFKDTDVSNNGFDKKISIKYGITNKKYENMKEKIKYKNWFKDNIYYMDILEKYWIVDNKEQCIEFQNNLYKAFRRAENNLESTI
ncbi:AAA family ATPase [Bombilactobacillus bombi]|nr:AAA family ATPase [Bombilactobacillus bombi]